MNGTSVMEGSYEFITTEIMILLMINGSAFKQRLFNAEYRMVIPHFTSKYVGSIKLISQRHNLYFITSA